MLTRFRDDQSGATSIEYALIGALVSVAIILGAGAIGTKLNSMFNAVATKVPNAP
ncbi:MAG TPA: Flp family type IVb pilin [Bauldia sp.]